MTQRVTGLGAAMDLVRTRGGPAQLCVIHRGEVLLDESVGCAPDGLFWVFSAGKPYTAVLVHQLAERGVIDLDVPIAVHWPGFARHGKEQVTPRHVLQHRWGVTGEGFVGDIMVMSNWDRSVGRAERARARWEPGRFPAYSPLAWGFALGEIVRRVTGRPVEALLREEVLDRVGAVDTFLGLPAELLHRRVPLRATGPTGPVVSRVVNSPRVRRAVIPAASVSATARDVARFLAALLDLLDPDRASGPLRGAYGPLRGAPGLLRPDTLAAAVRPTDRGQVDRTLGVRARWSEGFELGGQDGARNAMGSLASPRAFGHNGSNICVVWADPDRDLAFAHLSGITTGAKADVDHHAAVADAVLSAVDAISGPTASRTA